MIPRRTGVAGCTVAALAVLLCACEDKVAEFGSRANEQRAAVASAEPSATAAKPRPPVDPLADLSVDDLGLLLQNERIDMTAKDAQEKFKAAVAKLPVKQKTVPLKAMRNAKVQHVAALVYALGEAGAAQVDVTSPTRMGDKMAVLKLYPEQRVAMQMPPCAVVAMIRKDNGSAIWHMRGGTALKYTKGLAGPDVSAALVGLTEQTKPCNSSYWGLTGEENVNWGFLFDLGTAAAGELPPLRATDAVLLHEAPVAGRPVVLAK
jgi:biopolymer transport protein ExbD